MRKRTVLVMVDWFAPGFKAGGPIRSAVNFADQLENELDIFILTTDRDLGNTEAYVNIKVDQWIQVNHKNIYYASPSTLNWNAIQKIISEINPDYIYLNSMFSRFFSVYPLVMKRLGRLNSKIVMAPRGMLKGSALQHKSIKKKIFIQLLKALQIPNLMAFHATDIEEEKDIRQFFGNKVTLFTAANLSGLQKGLFTPIVKIPGELKMIFIGRIHPIKNLDFLLHILKSIDEKIALTIVTTPEDLHYWERCKNIISQLPVNITVTIKENLPHDQVEAVINEHHLFSLPTLGENYGHAIFESLVLGRPVLISDQTPWRNLEAIQAGWDLPLNDKKAFAAAIKKAVSWDQTGFDIHCKSAFDFAAKSGKGELLIPKYMEIFS